MKSVNLQYDTLVRWANETNDSSTKHLMFQVLSFFHKITKMKVKSFEFPMSITNYEKKNNNWNMRHLVNNLFVPFAQQTSVLYCRLSDLWSMSP